MRSRVRWFPLLVVLLGVIALPIVPAVAQTDELVIGLATDPLNLDPRGAAHIIAWSVVYHIADPLVAKDKDVKIVPMLAESWDRPDPRTWRFRLRKGVTFHNGEPFTSESVKATIEAMLRPEQMKAHNIQISSQIAAGLRGIERVETPDPHTAIIVTKTPFRPLLVNLSVLGMAPASALTAGAAYVVRPVGTGPYRLAEYVPGSRVALEANPTYWGAKPKFKRLVFRIMPENATRVAALLSGDVRGITNVPPDAIDRIRSHKDLEVRSTLTSRYTFLFLQNDRPPFNDKRVRLAVNYALDKDQISRGLYKGLARPASAPMGPAAAYYNEKLKPYAFDLAQAKKLLADAGYPGGLKITMGTPSGRFINDRQVAEAAAAMLTRAGFTVDLKVEEWGTMLANMFARKYDAIFGAFGGSTDPDYMFNWLYAAKTSLMGYNNPQVEALVAEGVQTFDEARARAAYEKIQATIWEDAPLGFLNYQPEIIAYHKRLKGFGPRADEYIDLRNASLE